ncbi:ribosome small subunit-dependent GTPase A [bacterium]|nr:ribosome small subunit-dependent GTPase A [bacterium]
MHDIPTPAELGWSSHWLERFAPNAAAGLVAGRVVRGDRTSSLVATERAIVRAGTAARLLKSGGGQAALPVVGDWVALSVPDGDGAALIEAVLARRNAITRGDADGTAAVQALAANVDTVFVVHPIAGEPNLRRLERELSVAWSSGATPVVVLTKSDLSADAEAAREAVTSVAIGVEVLTVNGLDGASVAGLLAHVAAGRTAILLGPSGAGKSTLINALLGEQRLATGGIRESDGRGRHTTVARELVCIPGHGVIIDTPGLRAIGLTGDEDGIALAFPDIEALAPSCRFRDCRHGEEPDCAVREAVETGELDPERLASWHKLQREQQVAATRTDARARAEQNRQGRIMGRVIKDYYKKTGRP